MTAPMCITGAFPAIVARQLADGLRFSHVTAAADVANDARRLLGCADVVTRAGMLPGSCTVVVEREPKP